MHFYHAKIKLHKTLKIEWIRGTVITDNENLFLGPQV